MYGKIFSDIFDSSIMVHGGDTVYVFMALICLADQEGYTRITVPALALRIGKPLESVEAAIVALEAPDPHSTTPDEDGRRIIPLRELTGGQENRGWWVVNYLKYRATARRQDLAEKSTVRKREWREGKKAATSCHTLPQNATTVEGEGEGITTTSDKLSDGHHDDKEKTNYIAKATEVLSFLKDKTGFNYQALNKRGKPTASLMIIIDRLKDGASVQDCKTMIARKHREWSQGGVGKYGHDMFTYLRPSTLFQKRKFEEYVAQCVTPDEERRKP